VRISLHFLHKKLLKKRDKGPGLYISFYRLNKKPFQISSDPAFMWFGEKHKEAMATLEYGILDNKGFLLLTGDVGTGKTTLINALLQRLGQDVICTTVPDPGLEKMDFFNYIAAGFGIDKEFQSKGVFLAYFKRFLVQASETGKKVLLIIDEAQLLTQDLLEEIRLLSNIEKSDAKLINIFFVGQNEFNDILNREQNRAVRQRLTLNYNIDPLTPDETADYIKFRLTMAGADHTIFDDGATQEIFIYAGGFPRRINVICDHCLLSGYVQEQKIIDRAIVRECAKELKIPVHVKNRDIDDFAASYEKGSAQSTPLVVSSEKTYGKTREKRPKKKALAAVLVFLLFMTALVAGYLAFPAGYQQAWHTAGDRFISLRHQIREMMPESFAAFIPVDTKNNTKTEIPDSVEKQVKANQKKNDFQKPVISEEETANNKQIRNNAPQIFDIPKENVSPTAVPSQEQFLSEPSRRDQELLAKQHKSQLTTAAEQQPASPEEPSNLEPSKEIPPLPEDKVVIRFKYNTNDFTDAGYDELAAYADILAMYPNVKIVVTGYTDSEGYQPYNQKLSEFRANIVGSFLLGKGIKPSQMEIKGLGSENPVETNDTSWGRMMNRRVEIEIKQSDTAVKNPDHSQR